MQQLELFCWNKSKHNWQVPQYLRPCQDDADLQSVSLRCMHEECAAWHFMGHTDMGDMECEPRDMSSHAISTYANNPEFMQIDAAS